MKTLTQYINQRNRWMKLFSKPSIQLPLTQQSANDLAAQIDAELSPENLTCDGELNGAQVRSQARFLRTVATELELYCDDHDLFRPRWYEL